MVVHLLTIRKHWLLDLNTNVYKIAKTLKFTSQYMQRKRTFNN